ncbi:hypothetical protein F3Y22_tig00111741pilonHSYRG00054 [Hibiscus syriacus]|uniref:VASt domain-containing protein n=1 Tax=Hibiscus syriacus TaxID=106335 RepID=A0A6A2YGN0_HIBSY|nr:hypothetical protein F3Y22_tig00111741pilonHSYRG00054 [Hibiscus syriacus]
MAFDIQLVLKQSYSYCFLHLLKNFACDGLENLRILWELKERGLGGSVPTAICPNDVFQLPRKQSYMVRSMRMCRVNIIGCECKYYNSSELFAFRSEQHQHCVRAVVEGKLQLLQIKNLNLKTEKIPFIKEQVLVGIYNDVFPCTAEKLYNLLLSDDSNFTNEYRSSRKDKNLTMGQWHAADEYEGQLREITFRSICNNPMCPPDSAMTEDQHFVLSSDKKKLV